MNRLGFAMLTLGGIFAFLGWHYHQDVFAAAGFTLLICLSLLATGSPISISYKPDVEVRPMGTAAKRAWGLYYLFALVLAVVGLAHTQAGGNGEWLILSGVALFLSLMGYDAFHVERFRAWQLKRLRSMRGVTGR